MAQPPPYNPATAFLTYSAATPTFPGQQLDAEFASLSSTVAWIERNLAVIQRDDTALANGIVTADSLAPGLLIGVTPATLWATSTAYVALNTVFNTMVLYRCLVSHTSGVFATDLAAGYWLKIADFSGVVARGTDTGYKYTWSTNTASSDPGSGGLKGNNATLSAITQLFISETDADTNALASVIGTWDDSTNTTKANLYIYDPNTPANNASFLVNNSITDNGTWDTVPVTFVASNGSFTNAATLRVEVALIGNKGADGAGSGDFISDVGVSVDGEMVLFSGTTGKHGKRATGTGYVKVASGVYSTVASPIPVSDGGTASTAAGGGLLDTITAFSGVGVMARLGSGNYSFNTMSVSGAGLTWTNANGVPGNPTIALANDVAALEALAGTNTIYARSGADAWSAVTYSGLVSLAASQILTVTASSTAQAIAGTDATTAVTPAALGAAFRTYGGLENSLFLA